MRKPCSKRNIRFIDYEIINQRYNCNQSKLHLNKGVTNLLMENKQIPNLSKYQIKKYLSDDSLFPILTKLRGEHPKNILLGISTSIL